MPGRGGHPAHDRRARREPGGDGSRKRHGRHYTPPALAEFLAERTLAHVRPGAELSILDPACGDGELLLAVARVAAQRFPRTSLRLAGYDLDADAVRVARQRSAGSDGCRAAGGDEQAIGDLGAVHSGPGRRIAFEWRHGDFLRAADDLSAPAFDAVITNPPYVRTQQLGGETARMLSRRFGLSGRIDLTHPFVVTVPRLLRPGGVLGLLCANRFLSTKAGANLRSLLHAELPPVELYDLGDTRLFDAAVLPAVTIAVRAGAPHSCRFVTTYETGLEPTTAADLFEALMGRDASVVGHAGRRIAVEIGTLRTGGDPMAKPVRRSDARSRASEFTGTFDPAVPWQLSRPDTDAWLRRIGAATWRTFGQVAPIRVGIKTTADRVFISDRWAELAAPPEADLLRMLLTHNDIEPWRIDRAHDTRVLYPYDLSQDCRVPVDLDEFPCARAYLEQHRQMLSARDYLVGSGREWFEIWVPQRPRLWCLPKVVFPDISVTPRFALDRSGAVVNGDCYWISMADIGAERIAYLLMGVANSALGPNFYDAVCGNRLYAGRRRWITQYVTRLPVPDPDTVAARSLIELARALAEGEIEPDPGRLDECVAAAFGLRNGSAGLRPGGPP
ncbi:N-6 DNA methylase [Nocardia sp. NPDC052254]|uniref:Eco57I restriction-modification methylase domain-containing protein n=1 Tax=Nocardia sp. NPDC052254 TaxID=3155681 RepID=UPI0034285F35